MGLFCISPPLFYTVLPVFNLSKYQLQTVAQHSEHIQGYINKQSRNQLGKLLATEDQC
jgi:hypothetical protein